MELDAERSASANTFWPTKMSIAFETNAIRNRIDVASNLYPRKNRHRNGQYNVEHIEPYERVDPMGRYDFGKSLESYLYFLKDVHIKKKNEFI